MGIAKPAQIKNSIGLKTFIRIGLGLHLLYDLAIYETESSICHEQDAATVVKLATILRAKSSCKPNVIVANAGTLPVAPPMCSWPYQRPG